MSNFQCEKCGTVCYDVGNRGYVTGCDHYPADWTLIKEHKGRIQDYGFTYDLENDTRWGVPIKELEKYSNIWEWFEIDESLPKYCVGSLYDIPYVEIPRGTLSVYGRLRS